MSEKALNLQIYYEIAMSIGNSLNLRRMLKDCLAVYLRKLNCSAGMVLQSRLGAEGRIEYKPAYNIPRNISNNPGCCAALATIPTALKGPEERNFLRQLPIVGQASNNSYFHIMLLDAFGLLVLIKGTRELTPNIIKSLEPINTKLAGAAIACHHSAQAQTLLAELQQEVTERKRAEEDLCLNRQKYVNIFENIQDVYYEVDLDGRIQQISPSARRIFGLDREALLGRKLQDFYLNPQERGLGSIKSLKSGAVDDYEFALQDVGGNSHFVSVNAVIQKDSAGTPLRICGSMRDITHRKKAEEALKQAKVKAEATANDLKIANFELSKLNRAIEQSPAAIVITDVSGIIEYVNPKFIEITGYSSQDVIGQNPRVLKSGYQSDAFYRQLWETITAGRQWDGEFQNLTKSGELFWERACITPVKDKYGTITHFIAIKEDISYLKKTAEELRQAETALEVADAARSQFLANMSHEIRTPLNGLLGMTTLLSETALDREQQEMLETIKISSDTLMAVMNDLLDYSKIVADQFELEPRPFEMPALLTEIKEMILPTIGDRAIQFSIGAASNIPSRLRGDATRLKQILINLTNNAIKFTEKGEVAVQLTLEKQSDDQVHLRFAVRDTGIGIPIERQQYLFQMFFQVDRSMTRRYGGAGMGLAISKELVERMGGQIGFDSRPNQGSTFWFTLPMERRRELGAGGQKTIAAKSLSGQQTKTKILVAEDNVVNQKIVLKILEKMGFETSAVFNGKEALDALERSAFDLVLMDVQMPEMDGLEATRMIREANKRPFCQDVPIVALTAHAMKGDRQACLSAGMNDYLSKPVNPRQLFETIAKHLPAEKIPTLISDLP